MRILFVEDDATLGEVTLRALGTQSWAVDWVREANNLNHLVQSGQFDLILLDVGLPGVDGLTALRRLRVAGIKTSVLLLTARDAVDERVQGLQCGADDYLIKPFALAELLARIQAVMRRVHAFVTDDITLGNLRMDLAAKRLFINQKSVELLPREWAVLYYLLKNMGRVVSKEQILSAIFNWDKSPGSNTAEVYVSRLRTKLAEADVKIQTVRGFGYLLETPVEQVGSSDAGYP